MSLLWEIKERADARFGEALEEPGRLAQDALTLRFDNGLALELRIASAQEYAFNWVWGEAQLRIDTAPVHAGLETFPNHLHDAGGAVRADPLTRPGAEPWENVERLVRALLDDPLLESGS